MNELKPKVAIIGAGSVGSTYAFALMTSGLAREIVIVDVNNDKALGETLDLSQGMMFTKPVNVYAAGYEGCAGADIVVVTAGAKQKPGQTRADLALVNAEIFRAMIPQIAAYAKDPIMIIVSNPVDALTSVAIKLSGYRPGRVFGSGTVLDTGRLRYALSCHCGVDARNVHAYIVGEHGDSELPVWSSANIGGLPLSAYCTVCAKKGCARDEALATLFADVKNAAYKIIELKGATNYAVAPALVTITEAVLRDENAILTVSSPVEDFLGIRGVCLSLPCIVNKNGIHKQLRPELSAYEQDQLKASAASIATMLRSMGL